MSPLSGIVGDRMSRKWLIVGSLCVWSGVTYLMGYATTFNQLYWLRGIMGISEALYLPAALSLIADFHKDKTRSLAVGIHIQRLHGIITGLVVSVEIQPATKRLQPETPGVQHIIGLQIVLPLDFLCHFHKTDP